MTNYSGPVRGMLRLATVPGKTSLRAVLDASDEVNKAFVDPKICRVSYINSRSTVS